MKRILALCFWLIGSLNGVQAQTIFYSNPQDFNVAKDLFEIGGWSGDRLAIFYTQKNESFIDLYDEQMNRKAIVSLSFMPEKPKQISVVPMENKIILLYSAMSGSTEHYYAAQLDGQARLIGKPKNLDEQQQNFFGVSKTRYQFVISENRQKMALVGYQVRDNKLQYHIMLIDPNLATQSLSGKAECKNNMDIEQILLQDNGTIVLNVSDLSSSRDQSISSAAIYTIRKSEGKNEVSIKPLELKNQFLSGVFLKEDLAHSDQLYFAGFYKSNSNGVIEGTYMGTVGLQSGTDPVSATFTAFDTSMLRNYKGRDRRLLNEYRVKDIVIKNDGGCILTAEASYSITRTTNNGMYNGGFYSMGFGGMGMASTSYTEYNYGDILIMDFNNTFVNNWYNAISKQQRTIDDYGTYSSYNMLNSGAQLVFTYNDIQRNSIKLQVSALNMDGQLQEKDIAATMKGNGLWLPKMSVQTDNKELVIPVVKSNKKLSFARLQY
ncbi:hypothetical protein [Edaphocola aurantiacus]|uniref:hypothetical protein n=1 Tax=Edaphocola aurantiacus TaxID=2601682 RepID=UPI001C94ECFF|nr:hypothetical protein [Edaphocola aurantiacus]